MQIRNKLIFLFLIIIVSSFFPSIAHAENKVVINEFLAHPETGSKEWVEFYNPDKIDLSSFYFDDDNSFTDDTGNSDKKSLNSLIASNSAYPYIELNSFLNNGGDHVVLFDSTGSIIDQYEYAHDPGIDISIGRSPDATGEFQILASATQGQPNSVPQPTPTDVPTSTPTPSNTPIPPTPTKTPTPTLTQKTQTPTKTPTPKPTITPSPTPKPGSVSPKITVRLGPTSVLGQSTNSATIKPTSPKPKPKILVQSASDTKFPFLIVSITGSILFIACAILIFLKIRKSKESQ
jgi:hypothetical protein